jgi:hypothetical protein
MTYLEVTPHLNKLVKINLKNKKRKTGWLFFDRDKTVPETAYSEVKCVNIHFGRKCIYGHEVPEAASFKAYSETFLVDEISGIRSCL